MACIPQRPLSAAECSYAGVSSGAWRENQLVNHLWSLSWCSVHMAVPSAAEHSYDEVSCVELTEGTVGRSLSIIQSSEFKGMLCFRGMMTWQFSAERFFLFFSFFFFSLWGKAAHFNKVFWCTSRPVLDKILVLTFQIILHTVGASVYSDSVWWFGGWCDGVFLHGGLFPHYVKTPDTQCNRNTFDVIWNKHNNPFLFLSLLWLCALKKKKTLHKCTVSHDSCNLITIWLSFAFVNIHVWLIWTVCIDGFGSLWSAPSWCTGIGDGVAGGWAAGLWRWAAQEKNRHGYHGNTSLRGRRYSDCKSLSIATEHMSQHQHQI